MSVLEFPTVKCDKCGCNLPTHWDTKSTDPMIQYITKYKLLPSRATCEDCGCKENPGD